MRATNHNGRTDAKGRAYRADHNDRNFKSKTRARTFAAGLLNEYFSVSATGHLCALDNYPGALKDFEMQFYQDHFSEKVAKQNANYLKYRHPERVKDLQAYYEGRYTCPEESILQIGKMGEMDTVNGIGSFRACIEDYLKRHARRWPAIRFLDVAIHADEASLHAHARKVYIAKDRNGLEEAAQNKCLQNMGFSLPDPDKPRGQYNNLKMTYTEAARTLWLDVCLDHGYTVDREPAALSGKGMELAKFKQAQEVQKLEALQAQKAQAQAELEEMNRDAEELQAQIREAMQILEWMQTRTIIKGKYTVFDLYEYETKGIKPAGRPRFDVEKTK